MDPKNTKLLLALLFVGTLMGAMDLSIISTRTESRMYLSSKDNRGAIAARQSESPQVIQAPAAERGFSLVVTVSMMVLLTLVAVGLLSLSTVSVRNTGLDQARKEARSNARMALMVAISELQNRTRSFAACQLEAFRTGLRMFVVDDRSSVLWDPHAKLGREFLELAGLFRFEAEAGSFVSIDQLKREGGLQLCCKLCN